MGWVTREIGSLENKAFDSPKVSQLDHRRQGKGRPSLSPSKCPFFIRSYGLRYEKASGSNRRLRRVKSFV